MCLAVPGQIIECKDADALVDLQGNRLRVCTTLTPDVAPGDWVLIHAGFAITTLAESDALETWDYLQQAYGGPTNVMAEAELDDGADGGAS